MFGRTCLIIFVALFIVITGSTGSGHAVVVSDVGGLQTAVNNANSGGDKTILIADKATPYDVSGIALQITAEGVTVRSQSGNRDSVVLDQHYIEAGTSGIFRVLSSNVTISDLTLKRAYYHAIHISPGGAGDINNITIDNVHIIDPGEQAIKINADTYESPSYRANNGVIQNSLIELTSDGRNNLTSEFFSCYTGGVDGHWAIDWIVRDNIIKGFWCPWELSEHGIHFWSDSVDILVERNLIIDCDRGIGFGMGDRGNRRGVIRNNMIFHGPDYGFSDVGISLESTPDAQVYNNTIYNVHDYSAIEYRFGSTTGAYIANNLTNRDITQRDGAAGTVENNITSAESSWFADTANGDLHLASAVGSVVDQGLAISGLTDDFDRGVRPYGGGYDIGADEYGSGAPPPPPPPPVVPDGINMAPVLHLLKGFREYREDFEGDWPPSGWKVFDNAGTGIVWNSSNVMGTTNWTADGSGFAAGADSNVMDPDQIGMDTELWSPLIKLRSVSSAYLGYASNFQDYAGNGEIWLDISTDFGSTWTNLRNQTADDPPGLGGIVGGTWEVEDLTPYIGSTVILRWRYATTPESFDGWYWYIDSVVFQTTPPTP